MSIRCLMPKKLYLALMINELHDIIEEQGLWKKHTTLKKTDMLSFPDHSNDNLYYIEKGAVRIFFMDGDEERIMRFGYSGEIVTALDSLISNKPSSLYIQALTQTQVKSITKNQYMKLIDANDRVKFIWQQLLMSLVYQQLEREQDLLLSSPNDRYQRVLQRSPRLFQEVPKKYIANYLRMTPETLSRLSAKSMS